MKYNNEFNCIDTIEKSYILGLIASDGCLNYNKKSGAYCVKLKLQEKDKDILFKIQKLFPFFCEPKIEKVNPKLSKNNSYYIYCYSKKFFNDLINLGIFPRKSYDNANKCFLPVMSKELTFSYLLGYFDGDSNISQDKGGRLRVDLYGVNENLYKQISNFLTDNNIKNKIVFRKDKNYFMLRISNKNNIKALIQNFEKFNLCLDRKYKPYFNIDWDKIPGFDNKNKKYEILFITRNN